MAHVQNDVKTEIMNITFCSVVYSRLEAYFSPSGSHILYTEDISDRAKIVMSLLTVRGECLKAGTDH